MFTTENLVVFELWCNVQFCHANYVCYYAFYMYTNVYRHGSIGIETFGVSTEPKNDLRFKLIVDSNIGFLLEFGWYSSDLS